MNLGLWFEKEETWTIVKLFKFMKEVNDMFISNEMSKFMALGFSSGIKVRTTEMDDHNIVILGKVVGVFFTRPHSEFSHIMSNLPDTPSVGASADDAYKWVSEEIRKQLKTKDSEQ